MGDVLDYYSRKDVQEAIVQETKNKEVAVRFGEKGYGKRPDVLLYPRDVFELAKQGATSFHVSEEIWRNPLELKSGSARKELDELRLGWDLLIDIDSQFYEYNKICAELVIEALRFYDIKTPGVKFSGNRSFHIGVPFEAFPREVNKQEMRLWFPDGARAIAEYLKSLIKGHLAEKILKLSNIEDIAKSLKISSKELQNKGVFDPFSILEIDTILISSRHMFRASYSLNEKSGLVSVPISVNDIKNFQLGYARPENVKVKMKFLNRQCGENEAKNLVIQAFDFFKSVNRDTIEINNVKKYEMPKVAIKEDFFPPCMKLILNGLSQDGRKRAVFVLINFLKQAGWSLDDIEKRLYEWNKKNYEPLREGYIKAQINWHRKQKQNILPANCDNKMYYVGIGVCKPDNLCKTIKNPVQYMMKRVNLRK